MISMQWKCHKRIVMVYHESRANLDCMLGETGGRKRLVGKSSEDSTDVDQSSSLQDDSRRSVFVLLT